MSEKKDKRIIIAISGATGAIYAERLIKFVLEHHFHVDLIISKFALYMIQTELDMDSKIDFTEHLNKKYNYSPENVEIHSNSNLASSLASGTRSSFGMVVVPCSMKTLSGIANGYSSNLIERAADVSLKENQPLVLVPRETPLSLIHIKNMLYAKEAGANIVPAMPAFYPKPKNFDDVADFIVSRILKLLNIPNDLVSPWEEK